MRSITEYTGKELQSCTKLEIFNALVQLTESLAKEKGCHEGKKKLYYISAEFLIGKLLSNNLLNLGIYDEVMQELREAGLHLSDFEEFEDEPSLGNGGLGRLASCFMDSTATLRIPADGVGLAYHCGLFRQTFRDEKQYEIPDFWLHYGKESFLRRKGRHFRVEFGNCSVLSTQYDLTVTGYRQKSNRLRLFDVDTVTERIIKDGIYFDKTGIEKNLTLFLYPDDSDEAGRKMRIYQEYFMVSNGAQLLIEEAKERGSNLHDLADYAAVQINDTHPSMVIPELIRLLMQEGIAEEEAVEIISRICAYTNHTILAEALETWPMNYLREIVPQLVPIVEMLQRRAAERSKEPFVQIIDGNDRIHMANMDIHFSHSVNGVAALHTEILKSTELHPFYELYPEKFNNKTNGITFRRWLMSCNPALSAWITEKIGESWKEQAEELKKLCAFAEDEKALAELASIKRESKKEFARWLLQYQGTAVDAESVFDIQSKRLHEYKRQQLNLLWAISEYRRLKEGGEPNGRVTVIFGAKAAPAYVTAKNIIHAILCFSKIVEADPEVSRYLNVVMVENYNITAAEKMIPACDISEQISLASKEASGTGNMKFMLNGALTLGTMDGANVEIAGLVGPENIYSFGQSSDEVIARYQRADYVAKEWVEKDPVLCRALEFLIGKEMLSVGDEGMLRALYHELLSKDWFQTFPDFEAYRQVKKQMLLDYQNQGLWQKKALLNIANAGFFSSDRTIREYNEEIWQIET